MPNNITPELIAIKPLRAVSYDRVSSQEQVKKQFSIPEIQIPQCKNLIKENGWELVNVYVDEGYDGNTFLNRPGLQKMLAEIDTYDVVVVWSFDRLVRDDPYTEAKIYNILDKHRKQVTSVLQRMEIVSPDKYDPKCLNTATQRKVRSIGVMQESLVRRERFMASKEALVAKGKHIVEPPYGYKIIREIDPQNPRRIIGYRTPDNEEVPILKRIFNERVLGGKSYRQIASGLNQDGIKTRKGEWWSGSRISQILRNPFPCGYIFWNKTQQRKYGDENTYKVIPEKDWKLIPVDKKLEKYYHEVIGKELFGEAQKIRKRNSQVRGRVFESLNILAGLGKCPKCKAPLVETSIYKIKKPPYKRGYYQCSKWANQHLCAPQKYPSWSVKEKVLEEVKSFVDDPEIFQEYLENGNANGMCGKEKELELREKRWEKAQKDIKSLNLGYIRNKIKEKYYFDLLTELEVREKQEKEGFYSLKEEIQTLRQRQEEGSSLVILSEIIRERFENLLPQQLKLVLRILIESVVPAEEMVGRGVKGSPRVNIPVIIWNNPAMMQRECSFPKQPQCAWSP